MTIIETRDKSNLFIEGIFHTRDEAEQYISKHPKPENCTFIDIEGNFPLYVIEKFHESFTYFSDIEELIKYVDNIISLRAEKPIIYIIQDKYTSDNINKDSMGNLFHEHFTSKKDWKINKKILYR
jgi:hypothetical protein